MTEAREYSRMVTKLSLDGPRVDARGVRVFSYGNRVVVSGASASLLDAMVMTIVTLPLLVLAIQFYEPPVCSRRDFTSFRFLR